LWSFGVAFGVRLRHITSTVYYVLHGLSLPGLAFEGVGRGFLGDIYGLFYNVIIVFIFLVLMRKAKEERTASLLATIAPFFMSNE
jgi:hypothetical protein